MTPKLPSELQQALASQHGFVSTDDYVLMTKEVFCQLMGVGTDSEMQASLAAIQAGLDDVNSGRTVPMDQLFEELDRKYGIHH